MEQSYKEGDGDEKQDELGIPEVVVRIEYLGHMLEVGEAQRLKPKGLDGGHGYQLQSLYGDEDIDDVGRDFDVI